MTAPDSVSIWLHAAFAPVYRCGGWAWARVRRGEHAGMAGGDKPTSADRLDLLSLAEALRAVPDPAAPLVIHTASAELRALHAAGWRTPLGDPAPHPDLWRKVEAALAQRTGPVSVEAADLAPKSPAAFVAAWADLAQGKARSTGPFSAAIPRSNLIKGLTQASPSR